MFKKFACGMMCVASGLVSGFTQHAVAQNTVPQYNAPQNDAPQYGVQQKDAEPAETLPVPTSPAPATATQSYAISPTQTVIISGGQVTHPTGYVEMGTNLQAATNNQGEWSGVYNKAVVQTDSRNIWNGEVSYDQRFDDQGYIGTIGNTHIWSSDVYTTVNLSGSQSAFFYPSYRADMLIYKKWLESRRLVTNIGLSFYKAKDFHHDRALLLGLIYYFESPWVVETGIRINESDPGSVESTSQFIALTYGRTEEYLVTGRWGFGKESYQLVQDEALLSDFFSHELSLTTRYWLTEDWGLNLRGEYYDNPFYSRGGVVAGVFREF